MNSRHPHHSTRHTNTNITPHHQTTHTKHTHIKHTHNPIPSRAPPLAPKPSRRPIASTTNPQSYTVPVPECGTETSILGIPDTQACPFTDAGLKVVGMGEGVYGEVEGGLEWPPDVYAEERLGLGFPSR